MNLDTSKCMRVVVLGTMIALPAIALAQTQPAPAAPAAAQAGATPQAGPPSDAELAKQHSELKYKLEQARLSGSSRAARKARSSSSSTWPTTRLNLRRRPQ